MLFKHTHLCIYHGDVEDGLKRVARELKRKRLEFFQELLAPIHVVLRPCHCDQHRPFLVFLLVEGELKRPGSLRENL